MCEIANVSGILESYLRYWLSNFSLKPETPVVLNATGLHGGRALHRVVKCCQRTISAHTHMNAEDPQSHLP